MFTASIVFSVALSLSSAALAPLPLSPQADPNVFSLSEETEEVFVKSPEEAEVGNLIESIFPLLEKADDLEISALEESPQSNDTSKTETVASNLKTSEKSKKSVPEENPLSANKLRPVSIVGKINELTSSISEIDFHPLTTGTIESLEIPDGYSLFDDDALEVIAEAPPASEPEPETRGDTLPEVFTGPIPEAKENVVATALDYIGYPYVWAGEHPSTGFDCSGFTKWVYAQHGVDLPHQSDSQGSAGTVISESEAKPGDLVIWPGQHVAIYMGNGKIVHASTPATGVITGDLFGSGYYFVRVD